VDHTVLPANNTTPAFTRSSPRGATTEWTVIAPADEALTTTHLSTPWEWKAELALLADLHILPLLNLSIGLKLIKV